MDSSQAFDNNEAVKERIRKVLAAMLPYLERDNGAIELVNFDELSGIATVRFLGNCRGCPMMPMTLRAGVERSIRLEVSEVRRVEAVQ